MDINLIWDSSVAGAPAAFKTAMVAAANFLDNLIVNPITVNIQVGYGEDDNGAFQITANDLSLGGALAFQSVDYSTLRSDLVANATTAADRLAIGSLPTSDPTNGATFFVGDADARALGLLPATSTVMDGAVGFSNSVSWNYNTNGQAVPGEIDFVSDAELELIHSLGMQIGTPSGGETPFMLFRYSAPGVRELTVNSDGLTTPPAYFSIDGGQTNLGNYDTSGDSTLFKAGGNTADNDTLTNFYSPDQEHVFSATDALELNVLGFNVNATYAALESALVTGTGGTIAATTIQNDYLAITRTALPLDQATTIANGISAGTQTESGYVNSLFPQVENTTIPAVAVEGSMYGAVGTSAEITELATQFLPTQVAFAMEHGFNPEVFSAEALGLAFASRNETGSTAFGNNFGPSNAAMPNSTTGDAAFSAAAAAAVFGSAETSHTANVIDTWVTNWKAFYTTNGISGMANVTALQIDLAARGAAWGDAVGTALANNLGPLPGQTTNFLEDAAQGSAVYSASLGSQPMHAPFQGSNVEVTGVAVNSTHLA
jgi:hypothetical protein